MTGKVKLTREERENEINKLKRSIDIKYDKAKSSVDYIIIVLHGIGATDDGLVSKYRALKNALDSVKRYWYYDNNIKYHLYMINWKKYIMDAQNLIFERLSLSSIKKYRHLLYIIVSDILFYYNPRYADYLINCIADDINKEIDRLRNHSSGKFKDSKIIGIGYSMGSILMHDLLSGRPSRTTFKKDAIPKINHKIEYFFSVASTMPVVATFNDPNFMKGEFKLPEGIHYYNIFHPYDPLAYRLEPLIYPEVKDLPDPVLIPYWRTNGLKKWYEWDNNFKQAKSLIVDNIYDFATNISTNLTNWWNPVKNVNSVLDTNLANSKDRKKSLQNFRLKLRTSEVPEASSNQYDDFIMDKPKHRETTISEENADCEESFILKSSESDMDEEVNESAEKLSQINSEGSPLLKIRYDYQLQEGTAEHYLHPIALINSHFNYWSAKDMAFFILRTITGSKKKFSLSERLSQTEARARELAECQENEEDRKQFLDIAESAKEQNELLRKEDDKEGTPAVGPLAWNTLSSFMKGTDSDGVDEALIENELINASDDEEREVIKNLASGLIVD